VFCFKELAIKVHEEVDNFNEQSYKKFNYIDSLIFQVSDSIKGSFK